MLQLRIVDSNNSVLYYCGISKVYDHYFLFQVSQPQETYQRISGLHQQPRPNNTSLRAGYITIPVIHEGFSQSPICQSSYPTREKIPIYREQVPIQIQQNRTVSPSPVPRRAQSPVRSQIMGERPQVRVFENSQSLIEY